MQEMSVLMNFIRLASVWMIWLSVVVLHLLIAVALLFALWLTGATAETMAIRLYPTSPGTLAVLGVSIPAYVVLVRKAVAFAHRLVRVHCQGMI